MSLWSSETLCLVSYADADDDSDKQTHSNTSGYDFSIFGGTTVSWTSQRTKCVILSSTESEYITVTEARKAARHLRFLLVEFQLLDVDTPIVLNVDNQSAIAVAEGLGLKGNLKHMEQSYAWLQQMAKHRKIALQYILATEQPADFLTKALQFPAFNQCFVAIGQVCLADVDNDDVQN
ncbi:unnamed protein product [Closterium sp. NIES-54]